MLPRPDKNTFLVLEYAIGEFLMNLSEISVIQIFMFINLLRSLRNTSEYLFKIYYFSKYFFYCATLSKKKKNHCAPSPKHSDPPPLSTPCTFDNQYQMLT